MLITANQPFADWNKVFPAHAMIIAAIDRLVHLPIIFEMNVESYRRRGALARSEPLPFSGSGRNCASLIAPRPASILRNPKPCWIIISPAQAFQQQGLPAVPDTRR